MLFHDISEIKKLEQMRRDFVANVSHELKTPITSLIGFAETLLDGAMEERELADKFLNIILNEGKRLQSLISDLLELSKIEEEHFKLNWEKINLKPLVEETVLILATRRNPRTLHSMSTPHLMYLPMGILSDQTDNDEYHCQCDRLYT